MRNEILTEDHKYWNALRYRLSDGLRLNKCDCTNKITFAILNSLPFVDISETLYYLDADYGHCDCEILNTIYDIDDDIF